MIADERLQQQTPDGFGFSTHSSLPFADYLEAGIVKICKVDGCNSKHKGHGACCKNIRLDFEIPIDKK